MTDKQKIDLAIMLAGAQNYNFPQLYLQALLQQTEIFHVQAVVSLMEYSMDNNKPMFDFPELNEIKQKIDNIINKPVLGDTQTKSEVSHEHKNNQES